MALGGVTWIEAGVLLLALAVLCTQGEDDASKGLAHRCLHAMSPWNHLPLFLVPLYLRRDVVGWARHSWNNALHSTVVLARQSGGWGLPPVP